MYARSSHAIVAPFRSHVKVRNSCTSLFFLYHWTPPAPMNTVLMGGSEETRSWTSEDEGTRWVRTVSWAGNGEETPNMQGAEPVEGSQKYKDFDIFAQLPVTLGINLLLTCSRFRLGEVSSCRFPSWFIQDVQRVVDIGVDGGERPETANAADDRHVLVNQRRHPLVVQVTAVSVVT